MHKDIKLFDFLAIFGRTKVKFDRKCKIWPKWSKNGLQVVENTRYFKISHKYFYAIPKSSNDTKTSIPSSPILNIFGILGENWAIFRHFPNIKGQNHPLRYQP